MVNKVFFHDERGFIHLDAWTRFSVERYLEGVMVPYIGSHDTSRALSMADYEDKPAIRGKQWGINGQTKVCLNNPMKTSPMRVFEQLAGSSPVLCAPDDMGDEYGEFGGVIPIIGTLTAVRRRSRRGGSTPGGRACSRPCPSTCRATASR